MNKHLIIFYPYKVNDFIINTFDVSNLKSYINVYILDISLIINKNYSNALKQKELVDTNNTFVIKNWKDCFSILFNLKNKIDNDKLWIFDELSFKLSKNDLLFYFIFRSVFLFKKFTIIKQINSGVPNIDLNSNFNILNEAINNFIFRIINKIKNLLGFKINYLLVAGENNKKKFPKLLELSQVINYNSNDFNNYLINSINNNINSNKKYIVLLDGAGPLFTSDSILTNNHNIFTSEKWYPALTNFLNKIEKFFSAEVIIAGHYKTNFASPSPYFGFRKVIYNDTLNLVKNSILVITRQSTAISYALIYKKPIYLVYSNELYLDKEFMNYNNYLSNLLDLKSFNVDNFDENQFHLSTNINLYNNYIKEYLTSNTIDNTKPNHQILIDEVFI